MRTPLLALLLAASANAATVSYQNTATDYTDGNVYTDLTLSKFNSTLGTLTGIGIIVNQLSVAGYFTITADGDSDATLLGFTSTARLQSKPSLNLGFTAIAPAGTAGSTLTITPGINTTVAAATTTRFDLTSTDLLVSSVYNITNSSNEWSNYIGSGNVTFQLRNTSNITNSYEFQPVVDTSNLRAFADVSVVYTYTAVPEPSTYGLMLGGLALAATAIRRRRKALKA